MRNIRNKTKRSKTPWSSAIIEEEGKIMKEYGLRRKREILVAKEIVRNFRRRARDLIASQNKEMEKTLLDKMVKLGLLSKGRGLDDVLALNVNHMLNRRLQTIVFRKGLANTVKQARQMITHGHVAVEGTKMTFPSYLVPLEEEDKITIYGKASVAAIPVKPQKIQETVSEDSPEIAEEVKNE